VLYSAELTCCGGPGPNLTGGLEGRIVLSWPLNKDDTKLSINSELLKINSGQWV